MKNDIVIYSTSKIKIWEKSQKNTCSIPYSFSETGSLSFENGEAEIEHWNAKYKLWAVLNSGNTESWHNIHYSISGRCTPCPHYREWLESLKPSEEYCPKIALLAGKDGNIKRYGEWDDKKGEFCMEWVKYV